MSGKRILLTAAIFLSILAALAAAQDEKNSLTGMAGAMIISDRGIQGPNAPQINPVIHSGHGFTFQVNYARTLLQTPVFSVSGEVPAVFNLDEDLNAGAAVVPSGYRQIFVTPAARVNLFPETALSPWASVGGGFGRFTESKDLLYYGTNPGSSTTSGVLELGIGVDVRPFEHRMRRFSIRGEVRDFWSGTPSLPLADTGKTRQHNYFAGAGLTWHF